MKGMMRMFNKMMVIVVILSFAVVGAAAAEEMNHMHKGKAAMEMHHFHMLMDHGLSMITEGSNMAMLAQMKMAPGEDAKDASSRTPHDEGRQGIDHSCPEWAQLPAMMKHHAKDPLMDYTHQLGDLLIKSPISLKRCPWRTCPILK